MPSGDVARLLRRVVPMYQVVHYHHSAANSPQLVETEAVVHWTSVSIVDGLVKAVTSLMQHDPGLDGL